MPTDRELLEAIAAATTRTAQLMEAQAPPPAQERPQDVASWIDTYRHGKPIFKQLLTPSQWRRYRHTPGFTITELPGRSRTHGNIALAYNNRNDTYFLKAAKSKATAALPPDMTAEDIQALTAESAAQLLPSRNRTTAATATGFYNHTAHLAAADAIADAYRAKENQQ